MYGMAAVIDAIADTGSTLHLRQHYGIAIHTVLARIGVRVVLANSPHRPPQAACFSREQRLKRFFVCSFSLFFSLRFRADLTIYHPFYHPQGRPVGILANNPKHLGGAIDGDGALKAARFFELCDVRQIRLNFGVILHAFLRPG